MYAAFCLAFLTVDVDASPTELVVSEEILETAEVYSPFVNRDYPDQVFFGDTHFHTNLSFDAGLVGTSLGVDEAFRFAKGEKVISNSGQPVQLIRPLDFLVITDHAEFLGLAPMIQNSAPELLADPWGAWVHERFNAGIEGRMEAFANIIEYGTTGVNPMSSNNAARSMWIDFVEKTETYDEPGRFSAMTGFEWSSSPGGNNLHRVVIHRDGAETTSRTIPYGLFDSDNPEGLWKYLADYENKTGGQAIAIPHNGNLSNGLMFSDKMSNGKRITREYAETRAKWEPLHEVSQVKGDEETHPLLSPEDEFADFETWDVSNISGSAGKEDWMLQYEYARSALKFGLQLEEKLGANPYKFGMIGASDSHTALSTTREENFFGKYQHTEPSADRHNGDVIPSEDPALRILTSQESASGMMAVWARENTRGALFDSMRRKEVYGTTGTRIRVRVFGGWNFVPEDVTTPDFAAKGYSHGVPMGGDLRDAPDGASPRFMIRALRDPDGANLDRVQIIKGWLDSDGETHERIYDVAVSDGREIGADGRARESVGSTVDIEAATFTNTIGDPLMSTYWQDPDFDPNESAFYYVRVLEIPTPRWTTYDAAFFDIERPEIVPATVQDRAYTSPIWYTP
ncbi:MAG: DUF3604 domain-containing protein [Woeseiaceae bacterium]|nr:DUF3604 domain-containing protein [Woeseiaceae bacterium]